MPFPSGWNVSVGGGLQRTSGVRSLRVFIDGRTGQTPGPANTAFVDNAFAWFQRSGTPEEWVPVDSVPFKTASQESESVNFGFGPRGFAPPQAGPDGTVPERDVTCRFMQISNDDTTEDLEITFDGVTVHGVLLPGEVVQFPERFERGIAVRSGANTCQYRIWAW